MPRRRRSADSRILVEPEATRYLTEPDPGPAGDYAFNAIVNTARYAPPFLSGGPGCLNSVEHT